MRAWNFLQPPGAWPRPRVLENVTHKMKQEHCKEKGKVNPKCKLIDDISFQPGITIEVPKTAVWSLTHEDGHTAETFSQLGLQIAVNQGLLSSFQVWIFVGQPNLVICITLTFLYCFYFSSLNDCTLKLSQTILYQIFKLFIVCGKWFLL